MVQSLSFRDVRISGRNTCANAVPRQTRLAHAGACAPGIGVCYRHGFGTRLPVTNERRSRSGTFLAYGKWRTSPLPEFAFRISKPVQAPEAIPYRWQGPSELFN